jgi:hypothetical protein
LIGIAVVFRFLSQFFKHLTNHKVIGEFDKKRNTQEREKRNYHGDRLARMSRDSTKVLNDRWVFKPLKAIANLINLVETVYSRPDLGIPMRLPRSNLLKLLEMYSTPESLTVKALIELLKFFWGRGTSID